MKKTLLNFKKTALIVLAVLVSSSYAMAGTFIAITSGDFSSASVWLGGNAPSGNMNGLDNITINAGVVVNLDRDIQMNSLLASLIVNGTLKGDKNIDVKIGAVSGTGIIDIKDLNLELGASFLFLGDATVDNFSNKSILSLKSNIVVEKFLYLMDGSLSILGKLTLADEGTLVFDEGDFDIIGNLLDFGGDHNILYQGNRKKIGSEATRNGLRNLIIDLNDNDGVIDLLSDLEINGILDIRSGNLNANGRDLIINGGLLTTLTGTITSDDATNLTFNITSNSNLLLSQIGGGRLGNLILNSSNNSTLSLLSNIEIGGTLDLQKGNLALNNNTLVLLGPIANTGIGYLIGTSNSNLVLLKDGDIGNLKFDNQNNILGSLILGGKNSLLFLGSDLNIVRDLDLTNGKINIMGYDLTLLDSGRILGYSKDNYIITDDDGSLTMIVKNLTERLFPVGSANRYAPATVRNNASTAKYRVRSLDKILQAGNIGIDISLNLSSVNNSWFIENLTTTDINIDLTLTWDSTMERNGFDRNNGFISHFTNSVWDVVDQLDAVLDVDALMWSMTRKNITSLSPFSVQGVQENTSGIDKTNPIKISVFPNPASQFINIESTIKGNISIYDMLGREMMNTAQTKQIDISGLNAGVYFIKINGEQISKFTKQ